MDQLITALLGVTVVPVAGAIGFLASSGLLLIGFAALWVTFGFAIARRRDRLDEAWRRLRALPIVVQGLAWLLFLPVLVGLLVWRRGWPIGARLTVVAGLAAWNLLVLLPAAA